MFLGSRKRGGAESVVYLYVAQAVLKLPEKYTQISMKLKWQY